MMHRARTPDFLGDFTTTAGRGDLIAPKAVN
jgi:hypothetical protein